MHIEAVNIAKLHGLVEHQFAMGGDEDDIGGALPIGEELQKLHAVMIGKGEIENDAVGMGFRIPGHEFGAAMAGGPAYLGAASLMETAPMIGPAAASWTMTAQFSKPARLSTVRSSVISMAAPRQVPMRRMSRTT